jgi:UDP-glucose 4-epimerase
VGKKLLVTGGAGFVGSVLSDRLLKLGYSVTIVDDLSNGQESNLPRGAQFIRGDLAEAAPYEKLGQEKFDIIFHIAAQASNALSFRQPVRDLLSNQTSTLRLLEFARSSGCKRLIFTSSMSAYGIPKQFPTPEEEPLVPVSPYAVHKAASEEYLRIYGQEYGIDWTTFRLYTTYGSGQNLDNLDQGLLSIYLAYLVKKVPIVVKGDLSRKRDIVHVNDVVDAIVASMDRPQSHRQTYNLCTGTSLSIREILDELIRRMGENRDYPVEVQGATQGDPPVTYGSYEKAKRDLGFQPKIQPLDGIRLTIEGLRR